MKSLDINKAFQGLYAENHKMPIKEKKESLNQWRYTAFIRKSSTVKTSILHKLVYTINAILTENPKRDFGDKNQPTNQSKNKIKNKS